MTDKPKVYETYFYNEYDSTENNQWYFWNKKDAEKKYKTLCKEYGLTPGLSFADEDGYTIGYGTLDIQ